MFNDPKIRSARRWDLRFLRWSNSTSRRSWNPVVKKNAPKKQDCHTQSLPPPKKKINNLSYRVFFLLIQFAVLLNTNTCILGGWCSCNLMCRSDRVFHLGARFHPANPPDNVDTIKLAKLIDIIFLNIVTRSVNILGISENQLIISKKTPVSYQKSIKHL